MGKSATQGGWWHKYKMPFTRSVLVQATLVPRGNDRNVSGVCAGALIIVRGYEDTSPTAGLVLDSGIKLPQAARMVLHRIDPPVRVEAYHFAQMASVPAGVEGLLFQTTIALEVSPPWSHMEKGSYVTTN